MTEPYFMTNKKWYYFDDTEFMYKLKYEAPPEARESYEEFYKTRYDENGDTIRC